ncbi:MAG: rRNA maturation RNase YbeY [Candidatus Cloacimonetes bacterium]|nr:rRNA maturation RNase YbeY [Candidatus Cloacimonadota bacterium]
MNTRIHNPVLIDNKTKREIDENLFLNIYELLVKNKDIKEDSFISVLITDDGSIEEQNRKYLGRSGLTDVISFPSENDFEPFLGDIIIDANVIDDQKGKKTFEEELLKVFLHGLLHLAGFDHISGKDKLEMTRKEEFYNLRIKSIFSKLE